MKCSFCGKNAIYRCTLCGRLLCEGHAKLKTACPSCLRSNQQVFEIGMATAEERKTQIRDFVTRFWGEQEQLTFDKMYIVTDLPAHVAKVRGRMVGFASTAETGEDTIIVALGVLPKHQGSGIGKRLVEQIEKEATRKHKKRLLVSTSNDDLPALAFYQALGFQIYEVRPNVIAEKHGRILKGIGGLPVRDELRLQKTFSKQ